MSSSTIQKVQPVTGKSPLSSTQKNRKNTGSTSRPHGKSKYAHKARVNANKAKVVVKRGPVNVYTSPCHGAPAKKPSCVRVGKKEALVQGLGKWRCTECGKSCKVTVSKAKPAESLTKDDWKPTDQVKTEEKVLGTVGGYTKESLAMLDNMPAPTQEVTVAG